MNRQCVSYKTVLNKGSKQSWLMGAILSIICMLHSALHSVETQHLDISLEQIELPHFTQPKRGMKEGKFRASAMHNGGAWFPPEDAKRSALGEQPLQMVRLENNLLAVEVLPRQGAALNRAYERDGTDWFYHEQRLKDWIPWWESGVKASFPFMEHGIREQQPSAWHTQKDAHHGARFNAWMEFSRHHSIMESTQFGRHSNMLLEQEVTLKPDDPRLYITYTVTNPMPYKQGLQCWNDALWPRYHHPDGVVQGNTPITHADDAEIIGPMDWSSDHRGKDFQAFDPEQHNPRMAADYGQSFFIWDMQAEWAGLYYPSVNVARIRLVDPQQAPGTKWWWRAHGSQGDINHNFIELWGGTDHVFEGVERWLAPGHTWQATWVYLYVQGIGKPIEASRKGVIAYQNGKLAAVSLDRSLTASLWVDGVMVACGPSAIDQPLSAAVEQFKRAELRAGNKVLVAVERPYSAKSLRPAMKQQIEEALDYDVPVSSEKQGNQMTRGRFYRNAKYKDDPLGRGRVQVRDGHLHSAIKSFEAALALPDMDAQGEAWHLIGACHFELEQIGQAKSALERALTSPNPEPAALYLRAAIDLRENYITEARQRLYELVSLDPHHSEGQYLLAFLEKSPRRLNELVAKRPADPRLRWIAVQVYQRLNLDASQHQRILEHLINHEPGAQRRVDEFIAITSGKFIHPQRLDKTFIGK